MIVSMTGYGAAEHSEDGVSLAMELRSLNHRYLKLTLKLPESLQFAEPVVEKLLRGRLSRGSVTCAVRMRSTDPEEASEINTAALQRYLDQVTGVTLPKGVQASVDLAALAALPGVCQPPAIDERRQQHQVDILTDLTRRATDALMELRQTEGRALWEDLLGCCQAIRQALDQVRARAPKVVDEYHERLRSRVGTLMQKGGFELEAEGLMREVAIYAERCDISEELTRLTGHLDQLIALGEQGGPVGRTMDFLAQELLREANTIGSKSNDATITRAVVVVKGMIDRLKEQVQNVE